MENRMSDVTTRTLKRSTTVVGIAAVAAAFIALAIDLTYDASIEPRGYVGSPEVSDFDVSSGFESVFHGFYNTGNWAGNLFAYPVSATGTPNLAAERWSGGAAASINAANWDTGRRIVTMSSSGGKVGFRWANLSATQQASINSNSGIGADVVNYVRGDKSNESAGRFFRPRVSVMGAVIHSRAMFVDHATAPTVYVGANDGMLHAINESTGAERWAYVPRAAIANVNKLSANPFAFSYFVDGGLAT